MSVFLTGEALAKRIRAVCQGDEVDCAVAFWGLEMYAELFPEAKNRKLRIVCDISMGCNSRAVLERLGASTNPNLKVHDGLHAKIYLSSAGVVIGSANASKNGIGLLPLKPGNLEAGTFHSSESQVWLDAKNWFESLFSTSPAIDQYQLDRAPLLANDPGKRIGRDGPTARSVIERVRSYPDTFVDALFVATSQEIEDDALESHLRRYRRESASSRFEPVDRDFIMEDEVSNLLPSRPYLVMFWLGHQADCRAYTHVVGIPGNRPKAVFGKIGWRRFWTAHGMAAPDKGISFASDRMIAAGLRGGEWVLSAPELAQAFAD